MQQSEKFIDFIFVLTFLRNCVIVTAIVKPMRKNSRSENRFSESRRRWNCGRQEQIEWPSEGGAKAEMQVVADGDFTRYQGRMYDGALNERTFCQYGWYRRRN